MKPDPSTPTAEDMASVLEWMLANPGPKSVEDIFDGLKFGSHHYTEKVVTKLNLGGKLTKHSGRAAGKRFVGFTVRMPGDPKVAS